MFGLGSKPPADYPGAISLGDQAGLTDDYFEMARFWVSAENRRSYCIVGRPEQWRPELLGSLLAESAETAATAYAEVECISREDALRDIWRGLDEHRAGSTDPTTEDR